MSALISVNIPALRLDGRQAQSFLRGKCIHVEVNEAYPLKKGNTFPVSLEEDYYVAVVWKKNPDGSYVIKKKSDD